MGNLGFDLFMNPIPQADCGDKKETKRAATQPGEQIFAGSWPEDDNRKDQVGTHRIFPQDKQIQDAPLALIIRPPDPAGPPGWCE